MKRAALFSALSMKAKDKAFYVVDGLAKLEPKTKNVAEVLEHMHISQKENALMVLSKQSETVKRAARNIKRLDVLPANLINTYEVLGHARLIFMKEALSEVEDTWIKKS